MSRPPQSIKAKALACIAQREHSRLELRRKLLAHAGRSVRRARDGFRGLDDTESERAAAAAAAAASADDAPGPADPAEAAAAAAAEIDTVLDWLTAKDLLSEERFVAVRVRARSRRFGSQRIRHELAQHGLRLDPPAALALQHSELARARAVWQRRFGACAEDAAQRARQMRFLLARGFDADVARRVVTAFDDKEHDKEPHDEPDANEPV